MNILITAPNSELGSQVLHDLLAPEFSVRVLTHEPELLVKELREEIEVFHGFPDDPITLRRALDRTESLFWCLPPAMLTETDARAFYERASRQVALGIRQSGTARMVAISWVETSPGASALSLTGWQAVEDILNNSGASVRHLRCPMAMKSFYPAVPAVASSPYSSTAMEYWPQPSPAVVNAAADTALRLLVRRDWEGIHAIDIPDAAIAG